MKNLTLFLIVLLTSLYLFGQNKQTYYLELRQGLDLEIIQKVVNSDETITIATNHNNFSTFINSKVVYEFRKAFSTATTPRLQLLYLIEVSENYTIDDFMMYEDIVHVTKMDNSLILMDNSGPPIYPNDYDEIIAEGLASPVLESIKAPLAWSITQGDPAILVGISDGPYSPNHEDMDGNVIFEYNISSGPLYHGTQVASLIVANNDNGIGMASIAGWNTKLVFANTNGFLHDLMEGLLLVSQYPGVKVINASFASSAPFNSDHNDVINEITNSGVLIIASAGNSHADITKYHYPASYDATLSVTTVGSRYPIGYYHDLINPDGAGVWHRSWKDCYNGRPDLGEGGNIRNDKVDVCAPSQYIISATTNYNNYPSGYRPQTNTSSAAPIVSGLAALIFSVNPSLTAYEVKDMIKNTADDIYYIPYNQPYIGQLGTGRINAYRSVLKAQCMLNPTTGIDLAFQNSDLDSFEEPDSQTQMPWLSKDIWVRNQNDGLLIKEHQNPEYSASSPNYVYVRVTNNSCEASSGTDNLKLYWAKANTALSWPLHWEGELTVTDPNTDQEILMGDEIATLTIPPLEIGQEAIIEFEWNIPNPEDYENINPNPWHFCLLARIDTPNDPMTFPEGEAITQNVLNNNNIAWKNTTVVDIIPDFQTSTAIGGVVAVGNYFSQQKTFTL